MVEFMAFLQYTTCMDTEWGRILQVVLWCSVVLLHWIWELACPLRCRHDAYDGVTHYICGRVGNENMSGKVGRKTGGASGDGFRVFRDVVIGNMGE